MNYKLFFILAFSFFFYGITAQVKTNGFLDSPDAYLGQTPPEDTPKLFLSGLSERIAISPDGKEIYVNSGRDLAIYKFSGKKWQGPDILFKDFINPGLSVDGNTLFLQDGTGESWYSKRNGNSWTAPKIFLNIPGRKHYLQVTNSGSIYFTTSPKISKIGDISRIIPESKDKIQSLENPINTENNGADFFIARDESYLIFIIRNIGFGQGDINISYHKKDGRWTNPKNLGMPINTAGWEWGTYVSPDNKYLFFTRDGSIYWVRIDKLIETLKSTNYVPYVKNKLKDAVAYINSSFEYVIPENTFFDDDPNDSLTYSVSLTDNSPLPDWLKFNNNTRTFSGIPVKDDTLQIRVTVTDNAKSSVFDTLTINVKQSK